MAGARRCFSIFERGLLTRSWPLPGALCAARLGLDDLAGAAAVLLGQNDIPVAGKLGGSVAGTSVVSLTARTLLPFNVRVRLPTIVKAGVGGIRIAMTRNLGAFVGRAIPVVGVILLSKDALLIMRDTVWTYNRLVKSEDRVL